MCASSPDQVEILDPPVDAIPGERISCEGYPGREGDNGLIGLIRFTPDMEHYNARGSLGRQVAN